MPQCSSIWRWQAVLAAQFRQMNAQIGVGRGTGNPQGASRGDAPRESPPVDAGQAGCAYNHRQPRASSVALKTRHSLPLHYRGITRLLLLDLAIPARVPLRAMRIDRIPVHHGHLSARSSTAVGMSGNQRRVAPPHARLRARGHGRATILSTSRKRYGYTQVCGLRANVAGSLRACAIRQSASSFWTSLSFRRFDAQRARRTFRQPTGMP